MQRFIRIHLFFIQISHFRELYPVKFKVWDSVFGRLFSEILYHQYLSKIRGFPSFIVVYIKSSNVTINQKYLRCPKDRSFQLSRQYPGYPDPP